MAANILAAARLELNHCNKRVITNHRLAIIASPRLAGHGAIAPFHSILSKSYSTTAAAHITAPIPAVCWRPVAISLQRDISSWTVYTKLSAAKAVLLGQSAVMSAQMPQSLSSPCSASVDTAWLPLWRWLPAPSRPSQV